MENSKNFWTFFGVVCENAECFFGVLCGDQNFCTLSVVESFVGIKTADCLLEFLVEI